MRALVLFLVAAVPLCARAAECDAANTYPGKEWPLHLSDKKDAIAALESYAFTLTGTDDQRLGLRTDSLLIIKNGVIVYERYARGYDASKRHISWSVAKSVTSALTGVAVQKGALTLDQSICDFVTAANADQCRIKVQDLIQFSSGIDWAESYEN